MTQPPALAAVLDEFFAWYYRYRPRQRDVHRNPDLMEEMGFLTPLERYARIHARLRMAARAFVDVQLHCGAMTLQDAASLYEHRVGLSPAAARGEAVKNSMFRARP